MSQVRAVADRLRINETHARLLMEKYAHIGQDLKVFTRRRHVERYSLSVGRLNLIVYDG